MARRPSIQTRPASQRTHRVIANEPTRLGAWEIVSRLAQGAWSTVYLVKPAGAQSVQTPDYVAKTTRPGLDVSDAAHALLKREAVIAGDVADPHVVSVLDTQLDAVLPYVVMPRLQGATLEQVLDADERMDLAHVLWITRQLAEGLAALHGAGWMHADIKPSNVIVGPDGHATLIDLGFGLRLGGPECAAEADLRGTLQYTAPEMFSASMPLSDRSDIYSLGVLFYQLLTGQLPFPHQDARELALAHLRQTAPNPRIVQPQLPRELRQLIMALLAKEPLRRPTAGELIDELVRLEIGLLDERRFADGAFA